MSRYSYTGRNAQGESVSGVLESASVEGVVTQLNAQRIIPLRIESYVEKKTVNSGLDLRFFRESVSLDDLSMFCRQMHALIKAGMPIVQAIGGLAELMRSPVMKAALQKIGVRLRAGVSLATAMREQHHVFSDIFVSLVSVGENTGRMDLVFKKLIDHIELERVTRGQVAQAFRYPLLVMCAMIIAIFVINIYVIPSFSRVFTRLGADLPLPTRILMQTSQFMLDYWWILLIGMMAAGGSVFYLLSKPEGRLWWDRQKMRVLVLGPLTEKIVLARFARSLAMMLEAGVPVLQALAAVGSTLGNTWIRSGVLGMGRAVERGESLTRAASATGMFTPLILQMLAVGEETGALDSLLHDVADFYEQEVEYGLRRLAEALGPFVLVFLGALVLVLALGVFLPMWDLVSLRR